MKFGALLAALAVITNGTGYAHAAPPDPNNLSCVVGPLRKIFGTTPWLVYGCDDGRSLVIVTPSESKARPYVFFILRERDRMDLHGEGTGDKRLTDAAFEDLKRLTESDVEALYKEAKAVHPMKPTDRLNAGLR